MASPHANKIEFRHRPLNRNEREIRLFQLRQCKDPAEPIQLTIRHANLDEEPEFEALSYTWGDEHPTYEILIRESDDDAPGHFTIRQNLHDFLEMQKQKTDWDPSTWFWVDQICINQGDNGERNHQVGQMAKLYSSARRVIVWLGPSADGSDELLDALGQDKDSGGSPEVRRILDECYEGEGAVLKDSKINRERVERHISPHAKAISFLLTRPYWYRVWIIQEVCLAREVLVCVGPKAIAWTWLVHSTYVLLLLVSDRWLDHFKIHRLSMSREVSQRPAFGKHNWTSAMYCAFQTECSDPRDRFYGVMALVKEPLRIEARYDEAYTMQHVLYEVVRKTLAAREIMFAKEGGVLQAEFAFELMRGLINMSGHVKVSEMPDFAAWRKFLRGELCSQDHKGKQERASDGLLTRWAQVAYIYLRVRDQGGLSGKVSRFVYRHNHIPYQEPGLI